MSTPDDEVIELYKHVLMNRRRVLGSDHPDTLNSYSDLANAYRSAGRIDEASELYEQIIKELGSSDA